MKESIIEPGLLRRLKEENEVKVVPPGEVIIKFQSYIRSIPIILRGHVKVTGEDDNGNEITFASPLMMEMTETSRPLPDCVRAFFGVDPHVEAAALAILDAAGFSDTVDAVDPTRGSSTN